MPITGLVGKIFLPSDQDFMYGSNMKIFSLSTLFFMLMTTVCGVSAHFFSKRGSQQLNSWHDAFSSDIIIAVVFYVLSTFSYLMVLRKVPLTTAYPIFCVSFVLIFLVGRFCFGEIISFYKAMGMILILTGIFLIAFGEYKITNG